MSAFFNRERFGQPQFVAGVLLLVFLGQCAWLAHRQLQNEATSELGLLLNAHQGVEQWHGHGIAATPGQGMASPTTALGSEPSGFTDFVAYDPDHSPLWYLTTSAPLLLWPESAQAGPASVWRWLVRIPQMIFAALLGASLWYVSRRLYGNQGGYIALALYCFSPAAIRSAALWFTPPEMGAAWGAFGAIFTAIAVAHTLYAPREVVLWNWRRIALLGLSLALAVGCQFCLSIVVLLAPLFMLYLAPMRRKAALAVWMSSCVVAFVLLLAAYGFHLRTFWEGLRHAHLLGVAWQAFTVPSAYHQVVTRLGQSSPALVIALPAALTLFAAWPRTRYFGNIAPLIVAGLFLLLAVGTPHYPGLGFQLMALPFLFVFVAGIAADLLETRQRPLVMACVWSLLGAQALWNLWELTRIVANSPAHL